MIKKTIENKPLNHLVLAAFLFIAIGYILAFFGNLFAFLLFCQLAFLSLIVLSLWSVRRDLLVLFSMLLFIIVYALGLRIVSAIIGVIFLVAFIGRSLFAEPPWRKIFRAFWAVMIVSALIIFGPFGSRAMPPSNPQSPNLDSFQSLPYVAYADKSQGSRKSGVVEFQPEMACPGLNLYNSYYKPGAYLLDMSGKKLHEWHPPLSFYNWQCITACGNGDLLVCIEDAELMRIDWNSRILWQTPMRTHHDIAIAESGDIYTLTSREELVFFSILPVPVINDYITVLSPEGTIQHEISLFHTLKKEISLTKIIRTYFEAVNPKEFLWRILKQKLKKRPLLRRMTAFDILHTNSVSVIDRTIAGVCQKGDLLISACALDLIGIFDVASERLRWTWGHNILEGQHHPTFLENGNILIFDNGTRRRYSRLIELDPKRNEIMWEYKSLSPDPFFSSWGGSAQRLQNGNSLITSTSEGKVFEITSEGNIVWEFLNPEESNNGKRATIYRMTRITDPGLQTIFLRNFEAASPK